MIRIAAAADLHAGPESAGTLKPLLADLKNEADLLLLAGDLTRSGKPAQAETLVAELADVGVPMVAVLGNHDYHSDQAPEIAAILKTAGIHMLDRSGIVLDVAGQRVAIAGTKGFGGGFGAALAADYGEPEMKSWIRHAETEAETLEDVLTALVGDVRIVLLHYSPVPGTLDGERLDLYPFLGNSLLGEAIDRSGADLVLHGHAHHGSPVGITPGGVPVRNVAQPVIHAPYVVFTIESEDEIEPPRILRRGRRRDDEPPAGQNRAERRRRPRWLRRDARDADADADPAAREDGGH
ncbi:MAG: Calcineurin-like phosphoesterase superfamily domain protein [Thermomicrobiales bacterium]|nr:Calcineurin-like phosphoesterase superfamily domain protein [Thermomicrobiales bacterium]